MNYRTSDLQYGADPADESKKVSEYSSREMTLNFQNIKPSTVHDLLKRLLQAKEYIDDHPTEKLSNKDIATTANMSQYHFLRAFRQAFGVPPRQYLISSKLKIAKEMIQHNKGSLTKIAGACGFPNIYSFSKSFKKHFGIAPSYYKKLWTDRNY